MLEMLEEMKNLVAMLAGIKQKAMDSGFTEETAELIVMEFLRKGTS
jgi:hypothetical protein